MRRLSRKVRLSYAGIASSSSLRATITTRMMFSQMCRSLQTRATTSPPRSKSCSREVKRLCQLKRRTMITSNQSLSTLIILKSARAGVPSPRTRLRRNFEIDLSIISPIMNERASETNHLSEKKKAKALKRAIC